MTAITALPAQNTQGVTAIHEVPAAFVAEQVRVVVDDLGADCVKTGMLHRPDIIEAVCEALDAHAAGIPLVVDPVMVAKGGASLLQAEAVATLKERLVPRATVLTPNAPEAEVLTGLTIADHAAAQAAAHALAALGPAAVMVKGGHLAGDTVVDLLYDSGRLETFEGPRLETTSTHGTGCTLASAIAVGLAQGRTVRQAVARARAYVFEAIRTAPGYGHGHGPLNHGHTVTIVDDESG
jgi:hydroxymethylpyrimidine/phosphomethylpyrimidine kinase